MQNLRPQGQQVFFWHAKGSFLCPSTTLNYMSVWLFLLLNLLMSLYSLKWVREIKVSYIRDEKYLWVIICMFIKRILLLSYFGTCKLIIVEWDHIWNNFLIISSPEPDLFVVSVEDVPTNYSFSVRIFMYGIFIPNTQSQWYWLSFISHFS